MASVAHRGRKRAARLLEVVSSPGRKSWQVLRVREAQKEVRGDADAFERALREALRPFFSFEVKAVQHKECLWAQLRGAMGTFQGSKENIYLVHPPYSQFLFLSSVRQKDAVPILLQGLCDLFKASEVEEVPMYGKDIGTLRDLALKKLSQGAFSAYQLCASVFDSDPLQDQPSVAKRRRKVIDKVLQEEKITETEDCQEKKNKIIEKSNVRRPKNKFTASGASIDINGNRKVEKSDTPSLAAVCVKLGDSSAQNPEFSCYVRLEGTNVLAGVEALYANDLVCEGKEVPETLLDSGKPTDSNLCHQTEASSAPEEVSADHVVWIKSA